MRRYGLAVSFISVWLPIQTITHRDHILANYSVQIVFLLQRQEHTGCVSVQTHTLSIPPSLWTSYMPIERPLCVSGLNRDFFLPHSLTSLVHFLQSSSSYVFVESLIWLIRKTNAFYLALYLHKTCCRCVQLFIGIKRFHPWYVYLL